MHRQQLELLLTDDLLLQGHWGREEAAVGWLKCCLVSSDVSWHIRDKLWPMPKHGSINLYVHGNQKALLGRTAQDVHLDSHTAPELWRRRAQRTSFNTLDNWGHKTPTNQKGKDRKEKITWRVTAREHTQYTRYYIYRLLFFRFVLYGINNPWCKTENLGTVGGWGRQGAGGGGGGGRIPRREVGWGWGGGGVKNWTVTVKIKIRKAEQFLAAVKKA